MNAAVVRLPADAVVAVAAVAVLGSGIVLALAGFGAGDPMAAAAGGLVAGVALVILLSGNWLDGLAVLALSLPLPALYTADNLRLSLAAPVTAAVVFAWLLRWGAERTPFATGRALGPATGALLCTFVLATLFARHPLVSVRESVNFALLMALFVTATAGLVGDSRRSLALVRLLVAIAAVCGALAILESLTILPGNFPRWGTSWNRAALGFGQPNALGLFLAVLLPLAVHRATAAAHRAERMAAALAVCAICLGLFGTFSRGSWLALLAGASAFFLTGDRRLVLRIWLSACGLAVALDVLSGGMLRDTFARTIGDWVIEQRAAMMLAGVLMFRDSPWVGIGPGGFAMEVEQYGARVTQLWDYLDTPHNAFIQMAAETGVVGLAAFVVFLTTVLRAIARTVMEAPPAEAELASFRRALLWSFATVCFAGMVVWPFAHGTGQAVVLIGALGMAQRLSSAPPAVESTAALGHRGPRFQRGIGGRA